MNDRPDPAATAGRPESLRDRNRARTRKAILEACTEIELVHGGALDPDVFTYANVAEIAGVSERTVYRFFPTKAELDRAYVAEGVILLGVEAPASIEAYPDTIEEVMALWSERVGHIRVAEREALGDGFSASLEARRERDRTFIDDLATARPNLVELSERQRVAITAALQSALSVRTIALTAQRWNLTVAEAGAAHAWVARTLLKSLAEQVPDRWEDGQ
jgi:AcrR family transcriptional regulator